MILSKRVMKLNNRVKDLREDSDLTQKKLAEKLGLTQRKYSYIETGVQPLTDDILIKLADFYGVNIDYILKRTDVPNPLPPPRNKRTTV